MAAPSTGHPVTLTIGTIWKLQPPPPRPPRLSVGVAILCTVLAVARVIFGVVYFTDCPQQPTIPIYLIGFVFIPLLLISLVALPCDHHAAQLRLRCFGACMKYLLGPFIFTWILLGDVWVFSIYQPNYDPSAADGLYCNKTLYTFAFWNAILETFGIGAYLGKFFKGLLCFVNMSPAQGDAEFV